ncbi:hypothetical protein [Dyella sp.]|uniref:hypothetical protein n=1 Tax=Dyella sp. TaxID=1869338 RepID=UPI003F809694
MALSYTSTQLDREVQLLIHEQSVLMDQIIGPGAGLRALGLDPDSDYAQGGHPDYLDRLDRFEIGRLVSTVERYVQRQAWSDAVPGSVSGLRYATERVFSPATVASYEEERLANPEPEGIPEPFEMGAGEVVLGHFYRGILFGLLELAEARLKVDQGQRLTLSEVALLVDAREATVTTNAHRKNFETVEENGRRYAEPEKVLGWLIKNGYRPTERGASSTKPPPADGGVDFVVVPVARGGEWFDPRSRHNGRYVIGAGRSERKFIDYYEALCALMRMPSPRWQTKRDGVRGIAFAIRFDRVPRVELDRAIEDLDQTA